MTDVLLIKSKPPLTITSFPTIPLEIGYLAACLEEEGIEVKVLDILVENLERRKILQKIINLNPKVVCILSTSLDLPTTVQMANLIKANLGSTIILSGQHISGDPSFIYEFNNIFDYGVVGEGEIVVPELVKNVLKKKYPTKKLIIGKLVKNLNSLPFPAYHLMPMKVYKRFGLMIRSSRGCPYSCIHCCEWRGKLRFRNQTCY